MSKSWILKETVPWILLMVLFATVLRLSGAVPGGQPQGGATTEQLVRLHPASSAASAQGVTGIARFSYDSAPDQTTIALTAFHLVAGSVPRVQIGEGTCARTGTVVQVFAAGRVDEQGTLRAVVHRDGSFVLQHWVITVQAASGASVSAQDQVLACGAL
jgi:hypothetical protein